MPGVYFYLYFTVYVLRLMFTWKKEKKYIVTSMFPWEVTLQRLCVCGYQHADFIVSFSVLFQNLALLGISILVSTGTLFFLIFSEKDWNIFKRKFSERLVVYLGLADILYRWDFSIFPKCHEVRNVVLKALLRGRLKMKVKIRPKSSNIIGCNSFSGLYFAIRAFPEFNVIFVVGSICSI